MIVLDERTNLRTDRSTIKAHHKELAHLPATWRVSVFARSCQASRSGSCLNRPMGLLGFHSAALAQRWGGQPEGECRAGQALGKDMHVPRNRRSTYLSRSSQPAGNMSSFGAMALGEECQLGPNNQSRHHARREQLRADSALSDAAVNTPAGEGLRVRSQVTRESGRYMSANRGSV